MSTTLAYTSVANTDLHIGTGGNPSLGNFPILPQLCPNDVIDECKFPITDRAVNYSNESVVATPGYFAVSLANGIHAEMTATEHAALYKFNFSAAKSDTGSKPFMLLDLTDLWQSRQNASVSVNADNGQIRANGTFLPSFGAGSYQSFVCVDFAGSKVNDTGIWVNNRAGTEVKDLFVTRGLNLWYTQAGGFATFEPPSDGVIYTRVGVSLISTEQACQNAEKEIPEPSKDFGRIQTAAEAAWREKLSPISVKADGAGTGLQKTFWSGVYRTMMSPQNYTGENPLWNSTEPYFDSYYW